MRSEPLLTAVPPAPVRSLAEVYAIAFDLAQRATEQYRSLAVQMDDFFQPVRRVFDMLAAREHDRADRLATACLAACHKRPDPSDLRWTPIDLVPPAEIADIWDSGLSTPYTAWALAVRHRQRAFVFWTYVIALAEDPLVRLTAESLAHEALSDGNFLRRERRLAWRTERKIEAEDAATMPGEVDESASAALLESLLLKDMKGWSRGLDPVQREQLLTLDPVRLPPPSLKSDEGEDIESGFEEIEQVKRRALRRAEQLCVIYLDVADRAADQGTMELAQKLAKQSIIRLAGLHDLASQPGPR